MDAILKLQKKVIEANDLYNQLRKQIRIPDKERYQAESIQSLSEPFLRGVFTLAIIGPMSAGKSMFINALLEDEDIMPTGSFQTTCTLTEIVYSTEKKLRIEYGDGHFEDYSGEIILDKIKDVAAINPKYRDLPINHINQYILNGFKYQDILKEAKILESLSGKRLDPILLKDYMEKGGASPTGKPMPKCNSNIPIHVYLEYPLSNSYIGWRIVDTPGIGAIGGIDEKTKEFLAKEQVDAAIFMFNGVKEIESNEIRDVVSKSYAQLSDVAKERTFFVITHAGTRACREILQKTKKIALQLFSEGSVSIPKERFFEVDSMLSLLFDISIEKCGLDPLIFKSSLAENYKQWGVNELPDGDEKDEAKAEVKAYREMIAYLYDELEDKELETNTENLNEIIYKTAGFGTLKEELGRFAKEAKMEAYCRILDKINEDFNSFGSKKKEDKSLLKSKLTKTPEEFEKELEIKRGELAKYREELQRAYNEIYLKYSTANISKRFDEIKNKSFFRITQASYYYELDNASLNFRELAEERQEGILKDYVFDCEHLTHDYRKRFNGVSLPTIDIEAAKERAKSKATVTKSYTTREKASGFWNGVKYYGLFGWAGTKAGTKEVTKYYTTVDSTKEFEETKADIKAQIIECIDAVSKKIVTDIIKPAGHDLQNQLNTMVENRSAEYNALKNQAVDEEKIRKDIATIDSDIEKIDKQMGMIESLKIV